MMRCLREINVDTNTVGWYQTCAFDTFVSASLAEAQLEYQSTIPNSIVIIYDAAKSKSLYPSVRAFQVNPNYFEALMTANTTTDTDKFNIIFREIPIKIVLSVLDKLVLMQEERLGHVPCASPLSSTAGLSKLTASMFDSVVECVDDGISEVGKLQYSLRNIFKQSQGGRGRKADNIQQLKSACESTLSALGHTSCQIEKFESMIAEHVVLCEEQLKLN